ncbi:MAG: hypothetical protein AAGA38_14745 [Pseudomonadota bacterium]
MSRYIRGLLVGALFVTAACGVPEYEPTYISTVPANSQSYAVAERAVRACIGVGLPGGIKRQFQRAGFDVGVQPIKARNGRLIERTMVTAPDEAVTILILGDTCYVGLEGMTPDQSAQLAKIWARAYGEDADKPVNQDLSDPLSVSWFKSFAEPARMPDKAAFSHQIYIAAYKTWPNGRYDPQRTVGYDILDFPQKPGAAVMLRHKVLCNPHVINGPLSGAFLSCSSKPDYRPN